MYRSFLKSICTMWRTAPRMGIVFVSFVMSLAPSFAQETGGFATRARNAILIDYDTGSVLYQKAADVPVPPASMSKLMTLAVLFKAMQEGKVKPDDEFVMSVNAWRTGGAPSGTAAMFVPVNKKASVEQLIQGIIIQSGNDACISVAEALAGTELAFAKQMEDEARRIGLKKSTFRNATGLHHDEHLMTARDLAKLARFLITEYPEHYGIFKQREFKYRRHRFYNRNRLLRANIGVDGLKTGHTKKAGYGIVVSAVNDGKRMIGVVMGLESAKQRNAEAKRLVEWGVRSFSTAKVFDAEETVGYARVWGGNDWYVPLVGKGPVEVVLPRFPASQKLRGQIIYQGPLKPPVRKGDQVAVLRVTSSVSGNAEPTAMSEVPLYAAGDVEPASFLWKGVDSLLFLALRAVNL